VSCDASIDLTNNPTSMTSPFRRNKKERRRLRKAARRFMKFEEKLREINPELVAFTNKVADLNLRMSRGRRRKKPKNST
jgi:hypothetical protein